MALLRCLLRLLAAFLTFTDADATSTQLSSQTRANPIRKVVNLLTSMQEQVEAEGQKEKQLYDKFMCSAEKLRVSFEKEIKAAEEKIPQLESSIDELSGQHDQLVEGVKTTEASRDTAQAAKDTAIAIRTKGAATYSKDSSSQKADEVAVASAIKSIERGQSGGAFLQTKASSVLKRLSMSTDLDLSDAQRDMLTSFLDGEEQEPSSGEVLGILKQMKDDMSENLKKMKTDEIAAVEEFNALVAAKTKEIKATTTAMESKLERKSEVAVQLSKDKNDLDDSKERLEETEKLLSKNIKALKTKATEYQDYCDAQGEELSALSKTIKILNDDSALDLFKKTLPSPDAASAASFLQLANSRSQVKQDALHALRHVRLRKKDDPRLELLSLALKGKQGGSFDIVVKKIEKLMANLETEQKDDEKKKAWCNDELDKTDEDIKWTTRSVSDSETIVTNAKEQLTSVTAEIDAVAQEIKELDAATKAATEQREAENAAYKEALSESTAAKEVLQMATTRLNQFYNPRLALVQNRALGQVAPSVNGHDADDEAPSFVQLKARLSIDEGSSASRQANGDRYDDRREDAEAHSEPTSSSNEKSSGALAMLDALMDDIDKQVAVLKTTEQEAQQDYEVFLEDSKEKRAGDTKAMSDKESAKAEVEVELLDAKEKMKSEEASLVDSKKEVKELHADCDDLLAEFEEKKTARKDEIEALSRAKAVLSGASYE